MDSLTSRIQSGSASAQQIKMQLEIERQNRMSKKHQSSASTATASAAEGAHRSVEQALRQEVMNPLSPMRKVTAGQRRLMERAEEGVECKQQ